MKRSVYFLSIVLFSFIISGCIISKSPKTNDVMVLPDTATAFSVIIFPPGASYTWTLDGEPLANATSSYQYSPTGGKHVLVVSATHIFGTDTQTWNIICPEASAPIGSAGGTVAVTETNSPLYGAQADIPAGALASTVTITITQVTAPAGLPGQPAGPCVDFGPDGTQFSTPVELSLPYPDADNDGIVDGTGISEDLVKAYYYNETTSTWEEVPVIGRDKALNLVRISVTHLSEYTTGVTSFVTWQRLWGGTGEEEFYDVHATQDGAYVAAGRSSSGPSAPGVCSVIKFDANGKIIWQRIYDTVGFESYATSIESTSEGGFIIAASSMYPTTSFCIIRLDAEGNKLWQNTYDNGFPTSVKQINDGGFIIAGVSIMPDGTFDNYIIKLNAAGEFQWQKKYGGSGDDYAVSIIQTNDGDYIISGISNSTDILGVTNHGGSDYYILKLDSGGDILWQKMYGGSGDDMGVSIVQINDDGYIIAGVSNSTDILDATNHGSYDFYIVRIDAEGQVLWQQMYGGSGDESVGYSLMQPTQDNRFIISGLSSSADITGCIYHGGYSDCYIVKLDAAGEVIWQKMYGGSANDSAYSSIPTTDGGYIIIGSSNSTDIEGTANHGGSDAYILKLDPSGNLQPDWLRDSDGDGILDVDEILMETNPFDADTDDDGLPDGIEDSNHNGVVDVWETDPSNPDTDGDGIQDGTESGVSTAGLGTDTAFFLPDLDPATTTNPILSDSDYDGIPDGVEDANHNGRVDPGESNPNLANQPPVAEAGSDQLVTANAVVTLDGSGSTDPDNNIASYLWLQTSGPAVTLSDPTAMKPTFTASISPGSVLTFSLTVTDTGSLTSTDTCTVRLNYSPTIAWQRMYGGSGEEAALSIQHTSDGGYVLAGFSDSTNIPGVTNNGGEDFYIIKLDEEGGIVWQKLFGGSGMEYVPSIQQTNDGGYIVAGFSNSTDIPGVTNHGGYDYYVLKLDDSGEVLWQRMLGGSGQMEGDYGKGMPSWIIKETNDGGYIVAGITDSTDIPGAPNNGEFDDYIVKLNNDGDILWQKMYGGSNLDYVFSVQQTNDNGYILAGASGSGGMGWTGHGDIIKLDANGEIIWQKSCGDYAYDVQQTNDGEYIVSGYVLGLRYNYNLFKLDANGDLVWQQQYGGSGDEWLQSVHQTSDGGYIVLLSSNSTDIPGVINHGAYDAYVIKLDPLGDVIWQEMYGGAGNETTERFSWDFRTTIINSTNDGGYILGTISDSTDIPGVINHGSSDCYVLKLDANGNVLWHEMYGGSSGDGPTFIKQTSDGGYIVAGGSASTDIPGVTNHGGSDVYIIKLNPEGSN